MPLQRVLLRTLPSGALVRTIVSSSADSRKLAQFHPASPQNLNAAFYRKLLPKKKGSKRRSDLENDSARRVSSHIMGDAYKQQELASALRARFGAGAVQVFGGASSGSGALASSEVSAIDGVIHLSAPASGTDAPHGSPPASVFFFTGSVDADDLSRSTCVSVWWGAEPSFEDSLLRDLLALNSRSSPLSRQQKQDRLAVSRAIMKWQLGASSELSQGEVLIDSSCEPRARVLDQLAFSQALQRHMKLLLLEEQMEFILNAVKRIVRQGRSSLIRRFLPQSVGGVESSTHTMQRLLLMREFNFDDSIMSTPDWLWEQPAREAMYDAMVIEYEIVDRIEAINQQLDYAQATMQSLKDDAQHQHSTFLEYAIVLLIAFEVFVEMHAIGWIDLPDSVQIALTSRKANTGGEAMAPIIGGTGPRPADTSDVHDPLERAA